MQHYFGLTLSDSSQNGCPIGEQLLLYHASEAVWDETTASHALHIQQVNDSAKKLHSIWNEESLVGHSQPKWWQGAAAKDDFSGHCRHLGRRIWKGMNLGKESFQERRVSML